MKLDVFRTLEAVLRTGTLAQAAAEMNLTPSAVSMKMKQLEGWLGQPLFDRSGLQVRPTPLAHEVAAALHDGLAQLEALRRPTAVRVEGIVRLGMIESMQPLLLPSTMQRLRERYPALDLRPMRGRSSGLASAVKAGELDAALLAQPDKGASGRLHWEPMFRRELVLVAPPGATESNAAALFRQYPWIRYDKDSITGMLAGRWVAEQIKDRGAERGGTLEFDTVAAVLAMVSAGLGVAVVQIADARLLQIHPVRVLRLGRAAPVVQFAFVVRKGEQEARTIGAVKEALAAAIAAAQRERAAVGL